MSMGTKTLVVYIHFEKYIFSHEENASKSKHYHLIFHYEKEEDVLNNGFQTPLTQ